MAESFHLDILCKTAENPVWVASTEQEDNTEELNSCQSEHKNRPLFVKDTSWERIEDNKEVVQEQLGDVENGVVRTEQSLSTLEPRGSPQIQKLIYCIWSQIQNLWEAAAWKVLAANWLCANTTLKTLLRLH